MRIVPIATRGAGSFDEWTAGAVGGVTVVEAGGAEATAGDEERIGADCAGEDDGAGDDPAGFRGDDVADGGVVGAATWAASAGTLRFFPKIQFP
jgi:hypothetical protein